MAEEYLYNSVRKLLFRVKCLCNQVTNLKNYANDAQAASGGVKIGGLYHNNGIVKVRTV